MEKVKVKFKFLVAYSDAAMNEAAKENLQTRLVEMTEDEYNSLVKGGMPVVHNYILHSFYGNDATRDFITSFYGIEYDRVY